MSGDNNEQAKRDAMARGQRRTAFVSAAVAASMLGLAYAAVPLYRMFCQLTGFGGTAQRAEKPSNMVLDYNITVRFDANVAKGLPWTFEPVQKTMTVKVGENALAFYRATNNSDRPVKGTASFNVSPDVAGIHFQKVECFCFTEQLLQPGETVEMPVSFYIDPKITTDRDAWARAAQITLSYTFYSVEAPAKAAQSANTLPGKGG